MRARTTVGIFVWLMALFALTGAARCEEKRFALLIGNQAYDAAVGVLKNPHNDIILVGEALKKQGFEILPPVKDAKRTAILGAVRDFTTKLIAAGPDAVGFLYYSGHGAAEKDTNVNYLIPVDAHEPGTAAFWDESLRLDDILKLLERARSATKFVVFDACRNELQLPTRDTSKGLVPVAEQQGFFIAYASAPGRTASDRGEKSGPYAAALSAELGRQGLDHLNLFQNVKEAVIASSGGAQYPWESNGLSRRIYLTGEPTMPADLALWDSVRTTNDIASLQGYLERFPKGLFAATAQQTIMRLQAEAAQIEAARQAAIERKAQEDKQAEELNKAIEEARSARKAMAEAETRRIEAEKAAQEAAARRETQERETQAGQKPVASAQPESDSITATLERQVQMAAKDAQATREALAAAEARFKGAEQRLAALEKSNDEKSLSGDGTGAQKRSDGPEVAALPNADIRPGNGTFDGTWVVFQTSKTCKNKSGQWRMRIAGTAVEVYRKGSSRGTIDSTGTFRYTISAATDGAPIKVEGKIKGNTGSGAFEREDHKCGGVFTIARDE